MTTVALRPVAEFVAATSLDEVLAVLAEHGGDARPIAGGTDLMLQLRRGEVAPGVLVSLGQIADLARIIEHGSGSPGEPGESSVRVGTATTHRTIAASARLAAAVPALVQAAGLVGGRQTQAVGTIGGNIANASPAADLVPPLAVYDAEVIVRSSAGERSVPILEFITGRRATALRPGELVTAVDVPVPAGRTGSTFLKVGRRAAMEISIASMAVRVALDDDGVVTEARIAVGACGPRPFRAVDAEAALVGNAVTPEVLSIAGRAAVREASPIDDRRGTAKYRSQLIPRLLARGLAAAVAQATTVTEEGSGL